MSKIVRALKKTVQTGAKTAIRAEKALERGVRGAAKSVRKGARSVLGISKRPRSSPKKIEIMSNNQPRKRRSGRGPNKGFNPTFRNTKDGVIVKNREVLTAVSGYADWTMQFAQSISPQNVIMMPWLASFAKKFDKYRLVSLSLHFTTRLGTAVSGSAVQGATQFAIIYDANDPAPTSYTAMMDTQYSTEKVAHNNNSISFHPKCALFTEYFISHTSGDLDLLSPADVYFSTYGFPSTTGGIGNLWVEYEVELELPRVEASSVFAGQTQAASYVDTGLAVLSNFPANAVSAGANLATILYEATGKLNFYFAQPGRYSVTVIMGVTTNATTTCSLASSNWPSSGAGWPLETVTRTAAQSGMTLNYDIASFEKLHSLGNIFINNAIDLAHSNPDLHYTVTIGTGSAVPIALDVIITCWGTKQVGTTKLFQAMRPQDPQEKENAMIKRIMQEIRNGKDEVQSSSSSSSSDTPRPPNILVDQEELEYQLLKKIEQTPKLSIQSGSNKRKT